MSQRVITTHILDLSRGLPAPDVAVGLSRLAEGGAWEGIAQCVTDADGRVRKFVEQDLPQGTYRLHFKIDTYFKTLQQPSFYPYVDVVFQVDAQRSHYHVPLLISPFGYQTYRGS